MAVWPARHGRFLPHRQTVSCLPARSGTPVHSGTGNGGAPGFRGQRPSGRRPFPGRKVRFGVHVADIIHRMSARQGPFVRHNAVIVSISGNGDKENKESYMCRMPLNRLPQNACGSFMKQGFRMFKGLGAKSMTLIASDRTFCPDNVQADCKLSTKIRPHLSCGLITCYCR